MEAHERCPEPDQLIALHRGELAEDAAAAVCEHLSSCRACEEKLAVIQEAQDDVASNIRRFLDRALAVEPSEYQQLEANLLAMPLGAEAQREQRFGQEPPTILEELSLPTQFGRYRLLKELGRGGMGIVYRAVHRNLNKPVAVKVIRPEYADNPLAVARFRREARVVGELAHPNIVTATDADEAAGCHFLVMELVDGVDLETLIKWTGPSQVACACEIVRQAAVGLQYIHEKSRVHRDLKPSNLMLSSEGVVKILDLGLAGLLADGQAPEGLTGSHIMGTADYMAPEQWLNSHQVDIRADIYSLGCTLYKLLTGQVPFGGPEYAAHTRKQLAHAGAPVPLLRAVCGEAPPELEAIVQKMMGKSPADRYATPREVAEALLPFAGGADCVGLVATAKQAEHLPRSRAGRESAETVSYPGQRPSGPDEGRTVTYVGGLRKRKWLVVGILLIAGVAIGGGLFASRQPGDGTRPQGEVQGTPNVTPPVPPNELPGPVALAPDPKPRFNEWYPVLQKPPVPLYFPNPVNANRVTPYPAEKTLSVDTNSTAMIGLGQTEWAAYRIRLGIRQNRWTGWVGLFFGYHETKFDGKAAFKFQLLELIQPNPGKFVLQRSWGLVTRNGEQQSVKEECGLGSQTILQPPDGQECTLQIEVRPKGGTPAGLVEVTWNGIALPSLTGFDLNKGLTPEDYVGWFGTFNRKSSSWYGNAELMTFERSP